MATAPGRKAIIDELNRIEGTDEVFQARFLRAVVVGSLGEGCWQPGDDVDVRAVYVLPTADYLGIGSFSDEFEWLGESQVMQLDLVAMEVEKVARLILKGHLPTLHWLVVDETNRLVRSLPGSEILVSAAAIRLAQLEDPKENSEPPLPADMYRELDRFIKRARLGRLVP